MRRLMLVIVSMSVVVFAVIGGCSSPKDVCPPILAEDADNRRCCEALRFCCDHLSGTEAEIKTAKEECDKFVNGTDLSCKSQYYSFLSFGQCKSLTENTAKE